MFEDAKVRITNIEEKNHLWPPFRQHRGTETWSNYSRNISNHRNPPTKSGSHIEFIEWSDQIPRFLHRFWGYHHCQIPMFCWWNPPIGAKVARRCSERRWFEGAAHGGWGSGNSKFGRWKSGGKNGARVINPVRIVIYGSFVGFGWWDLTWIAHTHWSGK